MGTAACPASCLGSAPDERASALGILVAVFHGHQRRRRPSGPSVMVVTGGSNAGQQSVDLDFEGGPPPACWAHCVAPSVPDFGSSSIVQSPAVVRLLQPDVSKNRAATQRASAPACRPIRKSAPGVPRPRAKVASRGSCGGSSRRAGRGPRFSSCRYRRASQAAWCGGIR